MVETGPPEEETGVIGEPRAYVAEVEGWPTSEPTLDLTQPAPTEPIPVEEEFLRVGPDGTVEHERVQRRLRRMPDPFADFWPALALILLAALIGLGVLWYLTRAQEKAVPSVVSLPLAPAVTRLQDEGFKTDIVNQPSGARPGTVFAQQPSPGVEIDEGSTVTLLVSRGPANVDAPNLVGLTEKAARDRLAAAGSPFVSSRFRPTSRKAPSSRRIRVPVSASPRTPAFASTCRRGVRPLWRRTSSA